MKYSLCILYINDQYLATKVTHNITLQTNVSAGLLEWLMIVVLYCSVSGFEILEIATVLC